MRVRVNVRISKIMCTPIKVGVRTYATYVRPCKEVKLTRETYTVVVRCDCYAILLVFLLNIKILGSFQVWQFAYVAYVRTLELQVRTRNWFVAYMLMYAVFLFIQNVRLPSLTRVKHSEATMISLQLKIDFIRLF